MKKILYTLLIGLVVISCQKEEYGADYSSITPLADVEVTSQDIDIDGLIERLISSTANNKKKSSSISAKDGGDGSYIKLVTGVSGGFIYEFAFDNLQEESCNTGDFDILYLVYDNGQASLRLATVDGFEVASIGDLEFLFTLDIIQGVRISESTRVVETSTNSGSSFTF